MGKNLFSENELLTRSNFFYFGIDSIFEKFQVDTLLSNCQELHLHTLDNTSFDKFVSGLIDLKENSRRWPSGYSPMSASLMPARSETHERQYGARRCCVGLGTNIEGDFTPNAVNLHRMVDFQRTSV